MRTPGDRAALIFVIDIKKHEIYSEKATVSITMNVRICEWKGMIEQVVDKFAQFDRETFVNFDVTCILAILRNNFRTVTLKKATFTPGKNMNYQRNLYRCVEIISDLEQLRMPG